MPPEVKSPRDPFVDGHRGTRRDGQPADPVAGGSVCSLSRPQFARVLTCNDHADPGSGNCCAQRRPWEGDHHWYAQPLTGRRGQTRCRMSRCSIRRTASGQVRRQYPQPATADGVETLVATAFGKPRRPGRITRLADRARVPQCAPPIFTRAHYGPNCSRCSPGKPGKTLSDAIAELREAVDFPALLCIEHRGRGRTGHPRREVALSASRPWNFPLAIFTLARSPRRWLRATRCSPNLRRADTSRSPDRAVSQLLHEAGIPGAMCCSWWSERA